MEATSCGSERKDMKTWLCENLLGEGGPAVLHLCAGPASTRKAKWKDRLFMHCASARVRTEDDGGEAWFEYPEVTPPSTPKVRQRLGAARKEADSGGGSGAVPDSGAATGGSPGLFDRSEVPLPAPGEDAPPVTLDDLARALDGDIPFERNRLLREKLAALKASRGSPGPANHDHLLPPAPGFKVHHGPAVKAKNVVDSIRDRIAARSSSSMEVPRPAVPVAASGDGGVTPAGTEALLEEALKALKT